MTAKLFHCTSFIFLIVLAILPASCRREKTADQPERVHIRFVNASSSDGPAALYLDKVPVAVDVAPGKVTEYKEADPKRQVVELRTNDPNKPVAENSESFGAGEYYTVVGFTKKDGAPVVAVFEDKRAEPGEGKARIHVIHIAEGADDLDVYPAGSKDALVESVNFNSSSYVDVDPGIRSLEFKREGEDIVSLVVDDLTLEPGQTETIIVETDKNNMLHAIQIENPMPAAVTREGRARP